MEIEVTIKNGYTTLIKIDLDKNDVKSYGPEEWKLECLCAWVSAAVRSALTTEIILNTEDHTHLQSFYVQHTLAMKEAEQFNIITDAAKKYQKKFNKMIEEDKEESMQNYIG